MDVEEMASPREEEGVVFDLDTYIGRYEPLSETRLQRLLFLGQSADNEELAKSAFAMAAQHLQQVGNARTYRHIYGPTPQKQQKHQHQQQVAAAPTGESGSEKRSPHGMDEDASETGKVAGKKKQMRHPSEVGIVFDSEFCMQEEQISVQQLEVLEARLASAQSRLAKDAIRTAYLALADFYKTKRGDFQEALKKLLKSLEYCHNSRQTGHVCLQVMELGMASKHYQKVRDYITKAQHTSDLVSQEDDFAGKLKAASALVTMLHERKYRDAALQFLSIPANLTTQFNSVLSAEDIVLYGTLLGLATLSRSELQTNLLNGSNFKARLELLPPLRDALYHYVRADYKSCLELLNGHMIRHDFLGLDMYLSGGSGETNGNHVDALLTMIRNKFVVQYCEPYTKVSLTTMASCFGVSTEEIESMVVDLIQQGKLPGSRIASHSQTLHTKTLTQKERHHQMARRVAQLGDKFANESHSMLLRLSCIEHNVIVASDMNQSRGRNRRGRDPLPIVLRDDHDDDDDESINSGPIDVDDDSDDMMDLSAAGGAAPFLQ